MAFRWALCMPLVALVVAPPRRTAVPYWTQPLGRSLDPVTHAMDSMSVVGLRSLLRVGWAERGEVQYWWQQAADILNSHPASTYPPGYTLICASQRAGADPSTSKANQGTVFDLPLCPPHGPCLPTGCSGACTPTLRRFRITDKTLKKPMWDIVIKTLLKYSSQ